MLFNILQINENEVKEINELEEYMKIKTLTVLPFFIYKIRNIFEKYLIQNTNNNYQNEDEKKYNIIIKR